MRNEFTITTIAALLLLGITACAATSPKPVLRGTGDLGVIIERAAGSVMIVETTGRTHLATIEGLGDLSHASAKFSRDARYAYIFGRDGGLTKIDLLKPRIVERVVQGGNSIGGAISQCGRWIAVSNYEPGGVRIFDAETLKLVADIPAGEDDALSKVVGLVDAPGNRFVFSLYDAGEIWTVDFSSPDTKRVERFAQVGKLPYDALISPDGRYYIAGLFGEDGMVLLDLWDDTPRPRRILGDYGRGEERLPVFKMPHLEGWAMAGSRAFVPAVGRHEVLVVDTESWEIADRIDVHGQPIFVMARPDGRQVWSNFAVPRNDRLQIIDTRSNEIVHELVAGLGVLHMEFTPKGDEIWVSVRDENKVKVYRTDTFELVAELEADKPSGIFFTPRAHRIGL
jgi:protein NirF